MKAQELTLVGLTDDGTKLVLVSDTGAEFTLPADEKLRAALRGDHARLGQLEIKMESALRPRDIQARIRSGESPESVAAAAQTTVDRIMGYATPVLAERAHIADRAQRASVRRKAGEGSTRVLGDAVAERLRDRNVDPETVAWDAWRREDGRWALVADYRSGGEGTKHAEFVFDAPGRYVVAENDEARWLVGEPTVGTAAPARTSSTSGRRLSAVSSDEELPLGEDAIELVTGFDDSEPTADLTATARAVRAADPTGEPQARPDGWLVTQATERPTAPVREPEPEQQPEEEAPPAAEEQQPEPAEQPEPTPARKTARRKGRASVPSWDEIMFGGGRQE